MGNFCTSTSLRLWRNLTLSIASSSEISINLTSSTSRNSMSSTFEGSIVFSPWPRSPRPNEHSAFSDISCRDYYDPSERTLQQISSDEMYDPPTDSSLNSSFKFLIITPDNHSSQILDLHPLHQQQFSLERPSHSLRHSHHSLFASSF